MPEENQPFVEPYESRIARYRAANRPRRVKKYPIEPATKATPKAARPAPKPDTPESK